MEDGRATTLREMIRKHFPESTDKAFLLRLLTLLGVDCEKAADVVVEIEAVKRRQAKLKSEYEAERERLNDDFNRLRAACTHPVTEYHKDTVDSSDSFTECHVCGKMWSGQ